MTDTAMCVCCATLRPAKEPRRPLEPPVCEGCRKHVRGMLRQVPALYVFAAWQLQPLSRRGRSVTMSPEFESRLPGSEDVLNMVGPGSDSRRLRDQHGPLPPLFALHQWARDWSEVRRETLPPAVLTTLVGWLDDRLDWAFSSHAAVDEFAAELAEQTRWMRGMSQIAKLVHRLGAPCPKCGAANAEGSPLGLFRADGGDFVECATCGYLKTEAEYEFLTRVLADELRTKPDAATPPDETATA